MKFIAVFFAALAISVFAQAQELTVFAKIDGAPKHYQNENGQSSGYAIDIAVAAITKAGFVPVVVNTAWKRAQNNALNGEGIITAFSKTPEREEKYLFSDAMYQDRVLLVKRIDKSFQFNSYDDLKGKIIGISRGSTYAGEFATTRDALILEEDNGHRHRLIKLANGRLDAGIFSGDTYALTYHLDQLDLDLSMFHIAVKPVSIDENFLGIPKNIKGHDAHELREKLNAALSSLKKDGTIDAILAKYNR